MKNNHQVHWPHWVRIIGFILLLGLAFAQMHWSSARKSAAFDETYHFISGYAYLHTGSPRLSWEHPPVPQVLAALPLAFRGDMAPFPIDHPGWQEGNAEAFVDDYLWVDNAAIAPDLIWAGRKPLMWLTLFFGATVFAALFTLVGEPAAWIGLALFAFDPNIIANGRLIGNDLAAAGFMFIAVWRLGAYFRHNTPRNLALTGITAGLAVSSKLTAAFLGPAFALIALIYPAEKPQITNHKSQATNRKSQINHQLSAASNQNPKSKIQNLASRFHQLVSSTPPTQHAVRSTQLELYLHRFLAMSVMALTAALTIWAVFGFEVGPLTEGSIPVPAPTYLRGLPRMFQRIERGTPTFLLGQVSDTGWWYYFVVTFLLKTPLPTLILLGFGAVRGFRNWRETSLWWIPCGLYLLIASSSTLQIGYRYILPVLVFGIALAASQFRTWPQSRWAKSGLMILGLWLLLDAATVFPDHLAYSNILAGGPNNTWRHFADMNVDWGMDLVALRDYAQTHPNETLYLSYFGSTYPSAYGVDAHLLPGFSRMLTGPGYHAFNPHTPEPGTYAISATSLHLGLLYEGKDSYSYFRDREPDAYAGRSILIYKVDYPTDTPITRAVVRGPSIWRHSPETLGLMENQRLIAKWAGSGALILPANGPARFVIEKNVPESAFIQDAIINSDARDLLSSLPAPTMPTTPQGQRVSLPVNFAAGPSLAGWEISETELLPGETFKLITYWRVDGLFDPPLSAFVHVLNDTEDQAITQWDGWPVASLGLEDGDIIVLEHPLTLPVDTKQGTYPIQVGLYRPPNGPRLPVADADRLHLTQVEVKE